MFDDEVDVIPDYNDGMSDMASFDREDENVDSGSRGLAVEQQRKSAPSVISGQTIGTINITTVC